MKHSIREKLEQLAARLGEIGPLLSSEDATRDLDRYRKLNREYAELTPVVDCYKEFLRAEQDMAGAEAMLADPDMAELAADEVAAAKTRLPGLELALQKQLLPKDPDDERNVMLELRAGTGGEESALFAAELFRMYSRYAERRRWRVEIVSANQSDLGGYREIICRIVASAGTGPAAAAGAAGAYSRLKFESGGHRVQRVPETETQGRIHTSACTVAVMPEAEEIAEVDINPADLRIDTFRASGAGGQHIQKTESAVRITHLPTGIVAECQDGRSQHANRESALRVLATRIRDTQLRAAHAKEAATRKSLVGSGDRSERIRTYNFPQGRVTDHRINLTLYKIASIMDGDLDELLDALASEDQAEQLAALSGEA